MTQKYRWINYRKIYNIRSGTSFSANFIGDKREIVRGIGFYCDRTREDSLIETPQHLSLPAMDRCLDWDEIARLRVLDLQNHLERNPNKQCTMSWSGGIDSTFILSSIIEYIDPRLLDRFTIGLTASSLWENPYFYRDQILPRFKTVQDIENSQIDPESIVISGTLGDKVICPELILQWLYEHPGLQKLDLRIDGLIKYLTRYTLDINKAQIVYESVIDSALRWNVVLETASDFLWWLAFNFSFVGMYYFAWNRCWTDHETISDIDGDNRFNWYVDHRYQSWAMNQSGRWENVGSDWHLEYKRHSLDTIYRLDKNIWYHTFKQKSIGTTPLDGTWPRIATRPDWVLAVGADGTKHYTTDATLDQDLSRLAIKI